MATDSGYITRLTRAVGRDGRDGDPDPYPNLSWLRSVGPVAEVPGPGGVGRAWFVTSYALGRACLADPRLSLYPRAEPRIGVAPRPRGVPRPDAVPAPQFLATDPPLHTAQRQSVAAAFTPAATERLRNFIQKAGQATLVGDVFDDAATGQGLLNYFLRALNCGAITENEALATGLTLEELRSRSFVKILRGRRANAGR